MQGALVANAAAQRAGVRHAGPDAAPTGGVGSGGSCLNSVELAGSALTAFPVDWEWRAACSHGRDLGYGAA